MVETVFFYLFGGLTLAGAMATITRRSAVMSAVSLTVSLLGVAGIFLLQGAEFLFVAQILLYIGGITMLFLFVIMLVNLDAAAQVRQFRGSWPVMALAAALLAVELVVLLSRRSLPQPETPAVSTAQGNTETIAGILLSRYAVAFELASILLLVSIVGSVWMGLPRANRTGAPQ